MRHSSFIMAVKSWVNMISLGDKGDEEFFEMTFGIFQLSDGAFMEKSALVEDGYFRADLLGDFKDMCGEKNRVSLFDIVHEEILKDSLNDRIKIDEGLVDEGQGGLMEEGLGDHEFLSCSS